MTIDEAIKFCYEKVWDIKLKTESQTFLDIAEWLEELKKYKSYKPVDKEFYKAGYNKAIDDFLEVVRRKFPDDRNAITNLEIIAEQLKKGSADNE